jgi:anti-sigma-K factor RskA
MNKERRLQVRLSSLPWIVAAVALAIALFLNTARHNAQLVEQTQRHNAQLVEQAERFNAQIQEMTDRHKAQLSEMAAGLQNDRGGILSKPSAPR